MTVSFIASAALPTQWGQSTIHGFEDSATGKEHVALAVGELGTGKPTLCRSHPEYLTGDCLCSLRCDCGPQLQAAMQRIAEEGQGLILYLRQEVRGIGLLNKIKAYGLKDSWADTVGANEKLGFAADGREYDICRPILEHLGVDTLRVMTNNPRKVKALHFIGMTIDEMVALHTGTNPHNKDYLAVKASKLGHIE